MFGGGIPAGDEHRGHRGTGDGADSVGELTPLPGRRELRRDNHLSPRRGIKHAPDSTGPLGCLTPGVGGHDVATPMDSTTASEEEVSAGPLPHNGWAGPAPAPRTSPGHTPRLPASVVSPRQQTECRSTSPGPVLEVVTAVTLLRSRFRTGGTFAVQRLQAVHPRRGGQQRSAAPGRPGRLHAQLKHALPRGQPLPSAAPPLRHREPSRGARYPATHDERSARSARPSHLTPSSPSGHTAPGQHTACD